MPRQRLDKALVSQNIVATRSQAESWIKLGRVTVNGQVATKPGLNVPDDAKLALHADEQYVSRAGLKLASVASLLGVSFRDAAVLDVGSSTGGFTDYALQHGARKVFAVDVGSEQLHPSLRDHPQIELHEKTDIRDFMPRETPDIVVIDVSFISLREILPHIHSIVCRKSSANQSPPVVVAMVKPQFESGKHQVHKGVIKNDAMRRQILRDFETWVKSDFRIQAKQDSEIAGSKGNRERFYLLHPVG